MDQYFSKKLASESEKFTINYQINGKEINFYSDNGVFSKNRIDRGSEYFIEKLLTLPLSGKVLDYGAGIGVIGITLSLFFKELDVTYCEINPRARALIKENLENYKLNGKILDDTEINEVNENSYDYIFLNPPIRSGKKNIYEMYLLSYKLLKKDHEFYIVIRKDKGMLSHKAYLESIFKEVVIISKKKGYYILKLVK